jgi:hypothetical protein
VTLTAVLRLAGSLTAQVTREERRLARDKAVYQRIKQAYAASGGAAAGRRAATAAMAAAGGGGSSAAGWSDSRRGSNAAGAVAAAARELRPVELVGIYEGQKEALEKELAAAKAEVGGFVFFCACLFCPESAQEAGAACPVVCWPWGEHREKRAPGNSYDCSGCGVWGLWLCACVSVSVVHVAICVCLWVWLCC